MISARPAHLRRKSGRDQRMYNSETNASKVKIRPFTLEDVARKVEWINNPENNQYLHYDIPLSYDKTCEWFLGKNNTAREDCVIEYDGTAVGLIGLLSIDRESKKAEFYISMGEPDYKRRGIATAATCLVLEHAFHDLKLNKVYLNVDADNVGACALYEKTGFSCEGYFKQDMMHRGKLIDRKRYAILKAEYEAVSENCPQ